MTIASSSLAKVFFHKGGVKLIPATGMLEYLNDKTLSYLVLNLKIIENRNSLVHIKNEIAIFDTKIGIWN